MLLIALAFFQVVFSGGVTLSGGVAIGVGDGGFSPANLPASCSTVAQAAWDEAELQWLPFELSPASTDLGDGCPAASVIPEDMSF